MTKDRFDCLIESIRNNGYDKKKIIIVNDQNVLLDGQHRACVLASIFGINSEVRALKIWDIKKIIRRVLLRLKIWR